MSFHASKPATVSSSSFPQRLSLRIFIWQPRAPLRQPSASRQTNGSNPRPEAGAELPEVQRVHRTAAVVVECDVVGPERDSEGAEVDRIDGRVAVGVAEEAVELE